MLDIETPAHALEERQNQYRNIKYNQKARWVKKDC